MRRTLIFFTFLLLTFVAVAQDHPNRANHMNEIIEKLDLTPVQKAKLADLKLKYQDLFQHNVRSTPDRQERIRKRQQLQTDLRTEMRSILTPSQQKKFRELNRNQREHNGGSALKESIEWAKPTEEQQAQIQTLLQEQRLKLKKIKEETLTKDKQRTQIGEVRRETMQELRRILSPDQFEKFEQSMNKKRRQIP